MQPEIVARIYRRCVRPLDRARIRRRDGARLEALLAGADLRRRPPVFVVVMPKTLGWLVPCLKLIPAEVPVVLLLNGVPRREIPEIEAESGGRPLMSLSVSPGAWARHGTVLDLLVSACAGDFFLLDHDCYVFDASLFDPIEWQGDEFLGGVDRQGFFTINERTGLRFPRTHFLAVRRDRLLRLREEHGVGCEKASKTPHAVATLLAEVGIGDDNFPPARMPFYDTLQLAMAVAFACGWTVRDLPVEARGISHVGGTARSLNQPGLSATGPVAGDGE